MNATPPQGCWIIDRKITIGAMVAMVGILVSMAVHTIALTRWLSQMETRLGFIEATANKHTVQIEGFECMRQDVAVVKNDVVWIRDNLTKHQRNR